MGGKLAPMSNTVQNPDSPQGAAQALTAGRPKYQFKIPEKARVWTTDPAVVVLREITLAEEQSANTSAGGFGYKFTMECVKHSIVSADGRAITWEAGQKDIFLEGLSPKVRDLLTRAYGRIHQPVEEESEDFFGSMTTVL
jgi:hypothetical protein